MKNTKVILILFCETQIYNVLNRVNALQINKKIGWVLFKREKILTFLKENF
jgi:hypothetical protein